MSNIELLSDWVIGESGWGEEFKAVLDLMISNGVMVQEMTAQADARLADWPGRLLIIANYTDSVTNKPTNRQPGDVWLGRSA